MSLSSLASRETGAIEMALAIEGIPQLFTTGSRGWDTSIRTTQYLGCLSTDGLEWTYGLDYQQGELNMPGIVFKLIDCDQGGERYRITNCLPRAAGVQWTRLSATLGTAASGTISVENTPDTAFSPTSGDIYVDLETIHVTNSTATTFTYVSGGRAQYGSRSVTHTVDAGGNVGELPLYPEVTDRPVSWYGRRCLLYFAEALPDGTLDTAEVVWRGRIAGRVSMGSDGVSWEVPADSIWDSLDTEVMHNTPRSKLRGIVLQNEENLRFQAWYLSGGTAGSATVTIPSGSYRNTEEFALEFTTDLNAAIAGIGGALASEQFEVAVWDGEVTVGRTMGADPGDYDFRLLFEGVPAWDGELLNPAPITRAVLFNTDHSSGVEGGPVDLPERLLEYRVCGRAVDAYLPASSSTRIEVVVEDPTDFTTGMNFDAGSYVVYAMVMFNGRPFYLTDVTGNTLTINAFTNADIPTEPIVQYRGDKPIEVVQGLWIQSGDLVTFWQTAFIENTNIPDSWKSWLHTADFDWTDIAANAVLGGVAEARDRFLSGPQSFRELFLEDLWWAGMVPMVTSTGLITARALALPYLNSGNQVTLDNDTHESGEMPGYERSRSRVLNQITFQAKRDVRRNFARHGDRATLDYGAIDAEFVINDRGSQQRYQITVGRTIANSGVRTHGIAELASHASSVATSLFVLFGTEHAALTLPSTFGMGNVNLDDNALLTHYAVPTDTGTRGVTNILAKVTKVTKRPFKASGEIELVLSDGERRSGFAPAGNVTAYASSQITLASGTYAASGEAAYFPAGTYVELRQWDSTSPITASHRVVSQSGNTLNLDAAPSASMQVLISTGYCRITLDDYDTAGQSSTAKDYLHVCDDADGLIATSSDLGFRPA